MPVYIEPDEHCFVFMLRQEAKKRDVVAINHALFFASLMMEDRTALLPKPDVMIFDEAHTLPDVCRNFFSRRMVQEGLEEIPTLVHEAFKGTSVSTNSGAFLDCLTTYANCLNILARFLSTYRIPSLSKEQFLRLPIQRLKYKHRAQPTPFQLLGSLLLLPNEVERLGEKSLLLKAIKEEGGRGGQSASDVAKGLLGQDDSILSATGSVAEKALDQYRAAAASNKLSARNYNSVAETLAQIYYDRLLEYRRERGIPEDYSDIGRGGTTDYEADLVCNEQGVPEAEPLFRALMVDFWKALRDLNQLLSDNKEVCSDMSKISPLITACAELSNFVSDFMNSDRDKQGQQHWDFVSWVEISEKNYVLQLAPVDVSALLGEALRTLHQQGVTTVFTSATITVDRQFTKFCHDIGLKQDELMLQIVDSPFDYQNQACLMVSSDFPKPEDPLRINKCIAQIRDAIEASPGGVFFLTTSHSSMRQAYEELTRCFGRKRQVLMQGTDSIPNLMATFKSDGNAILVGTNTALLDNPSLTVRRWSGKSPVRLVIDRERKIPASYHLLDDTIPTIVFTTGEKKKIGQTEYIPLDFRISIVHQILQCLFERQLNSLMVEGGSIMLQQFLDSGYWDRAIVEESPLALGAGVKAPVFTFGQQSFDSFGGHIFRIYTHHRK